FERFAKWTRRHPTLATAIVAALLLSALLVSGGVWLALQRAELAHAVEADLKDVTTLQQQARWPEARAALERAEARLGGRGPGKLRQRFDQATGDLDLVIKLDNIRLSRVTSGELIVY